MANDERRFSVGQQLRIRIRPEFRDDRKRVHDLLADIGPGEGANADQLAHLSVVLSAQDETELTRGNFENVFVYLKAMIDDGNEPYLQLKFSDSLPASSAQR